MCKHPELEKVLNLAKQDLEERLSRPLTLNDLPELSEMVCIIEKLEKYGYTSEGESYPPTMSKDWTMGRIDSELDAVEIYYDEWLKTRDDAFKQIAKDEARHAEILIRQAQAQGKDIAAQWQRLTALLQKLG